MPAINCPKPGGNVSVETSKVTNAGYSRRLGREGRERKRGTQDQSMGLLTKTCLPWSLYPSVKYSRVSGHQYIKSTKAF